MYVDTLTLEVTRKCNLKCGHCLRGCAQNKTMTEDVIAAIFSHIDHVYNLVIGGGEPSLATETIHQIYQYLLWRDVSIENIFIVTNGKKISKQLLHEFNRLYGLCGNSSEISGFAISNDEFHVAERGFYRHKEDYSQLLYDDGQYDFSNITEELIQEHTNKNSNNWLARGRAKDFGSQHDAYKDSLLLNNLEQPTSIRGDMYICHNGDVIGDINMPYNDMKKYTRGNIMNWSNLLKGLKQSTIDNYKWCLGNCPYGMSPDHDETDKNICSQWYDYKDIVIEIKNKYL